MNIPDEDAIFLGVIFAAAVLIPAIAGIILWIR